MPPKRIKAEQRLDFTLTLQERDLIIERTFIDAEMEERLRAAAPLGSRLIVQLTLADVDDLAGHVAAEANPWESALDQASAQAKVPLFAAEIRRIFTTEGLRAYFATTTRVGPAAHVATEEQYQTMRDAGAFDEDVVTGAADALLFERACALLLGGATSDDLR